MILAGAVERNHQIVEEAAILRRDGLLMSFEREFVLLHAPDIPVFRHILGMLAHAAPGDAVLHFGNLQPQVGEMQFVKKSEALRKTARPHHAAQPYREVFPKPDLGTRHALDAADHGERSAPVAASIPAASKTPTMLVEHCMMVVKVGTCGSSLLSSHTSRARLA